MKLNQLTSIDPILFEEIDSKNVSPYSTEDLIKLSKVDTNPNWSKPMGASEALEYLKNIKSS